MARSNKFTSLVSANEVATWLGEVIQEKVSKENAGLVEIRIEKGTGMMRQSPTLVLSYPDSNISYKLEISRWTA